MYKDKKNFSSTFEKLLLIVILEIEKNHLNFVIYCHCKVRTCLNEFFFIHKFRKITKGLIR